MNLEDYKELLADLSDEDFNKFYKLLDDNPNKGACFNSKRLSFENIKSLISGSELIQDSYFSYLYGTIVGNNPLYFAGGFYPLDYSSFSVSKNIYSKVKDFKELKVLDLCAAPGGKSIALSSLINPSFIVCNDISFKRAEVLKLNIERTGINNAVVTSLEPIKFLDKFESYFDLIILDAPCSGSGMSRKKEKMDEDWSWDKVNKLIPIQKELIMTAYKLLRYDGILSYSTCSYAKEEDEEIIEYLLSETNAEIIKIDDDGSLECKNGLGRKYIPGLFNGEGQYHCLIRKKDKGLNNEFEPLKSLNNSDFKEYKCISYKGSKRLFTTIDQRVLSLNPLKLGYCVDDKTMYAKCPYDWDLCHANNLFINVELSLENAKKYIRGEDIISPTEHVEDKDVVATFNNLPLGFMKGKKGRFRNYLPKGLRIH